MIFHGPFPLDLRAPNAAVSAALAVLRTGRVSELPDSPVTQPGLYLLLSGDALVGFWILLDEAWLLYGTAGPPDRFPPIASALLGAATEAVWWKGLPVQRTGRQWDPVIVLEWPPALADRASVGPRGTVDDAEHEDAPDEPDADDGWYDPIGQNAPAPRPAPAPTAVSPGVLRSLITVIAGRLEFENTLHRGRWHLVPPQVFEVEGATPDEWIPAAAQRRRKSDTPTPDRVGVDLVGPRGRVVHPMAGWLTRTLELWPPAAGDVQVGTLSDRDIESPWRRQAVLAVTFATVSLLPVLLLTLLVRAIAEPELSTAAPKGQVEAQPAISVCSADHETFVNELRCQIGLVSEGAGLPAPGCSDADATTLTTDTGADLQATWCGIFDRARDGALIHVELEGGGAKEYRPAEYAAVQACFNVLGRPEPYQLRTSEGRLLGDPDRFLVNDALRFRPLEEVLDVLARRCDDIRPRVEERVTGAIFATHIGTDAPPPSGGGVLREALSARATPRSPDLTACFDAGVASGVDVATLERMCGDSDASPSEDIWTELAGNAERADAIQRYASARFVGDAGGADDLWTCHRVLTGDARLDVSEPPTAPWGLPVPLHTTYDVFGGGVETQLQLDAVMLSGAGDGAAGACWKIVAERLAGYTPVHPLLGELDPGTWPSVDQQLCGQVCAAHYQVATSPQAAGWLTPDADLARCVDTSATVGSGTLERLFLPWNDFSRAPAGRRCEGTRKPPTAAEICSFNLVAQSRFADVQPDLLQAGLTGASWAGEVDGRPLAGSLEGQAALSAVALGTYGGTRSLRTCAAVATQCFTSEMLAVIDAPGLRRQQWLDAWQRRVTNFGGGDAQLCAQERRDSPWCDLIQPYLSTDGLLPEGQFDYPCAKGVEDARVAVEATLRALATNVNSAQVAP